MAIITAFVCYKIVNVALGSGVAIDLDGRVGDILIEKLANGIVLMIIIIIVNYIDTQSRNVIY